MQHRDDGERKQRCWLGSPSSRAPHGRHAVVSSHMHHTEMPILLIDSEERRKNETITDQDGYNGLGGCALRPRSQVLPDGRFEKQRAQRQNDYGSGRICQIGRMMRTPYPPNPAKSVLIRNHFALAPFLSQSINGNAISVRCMSDDQRRPVVAAATSGMRVARAVPISSMDSGRAARRRPR